MVEIKNIVPENNLNSMNLENLEEYRENIDERIGAMKGEESLKNHKGYTSSEMKDRLKECIKLKQ